MATADKVTMPMQKVTLLELRELRVLCNQLKEDQDLLKKMLIATHKKEIEEILKQKEDSGKMNAQG